MTPHCPVAKSRELARRSASNMVRVISSSEGTRVASHATSSTCTSARRALSTPYRAKHHDLTDEETALGSQPSTIWTPRDHNLMAKDVDEPHGNRQQRISGVAVAGRGPSPDGHGCGRSHFRHRDRFVAGTRQLLGQRLRLLRQSGRQYALCGDQRADHRRRPVMQRGMNGRSRPKLRPEPVREPLPPRKVYAPPRAVRDRRRRT